MVPYIMNYLKISNSIRGTYGVSSSRGGATRVNMQAVKATERLFTSRLMPFEYHEPRTTGEAVLLLGRYRGKARVLAGGTNLLAGMKKEKNPPKALINLKKIPALAYPPKLERSKIVLSPLTTLSETAENALLQSKASLIAKTAGMMASGQVRNLATIGGNLCTGSPCADMAPPLIVLDAKAVIKTRRTQEIIPLEDFFNGCGETVLESDSLLVQIQLPAPDKNDQAVYRKHFVSSSMELPIISVAVRVKRKKKRITKIRIAAGGAGPSPIRLKEAEKAILGTDGSGSVILTAAEAASGECRPLSDTRGSTEYKADMVKVYVARILKEILA